MRVHSYMLTIIVAELVELLINAQFVAAASGFPRHQHSPIPSTWNPTQLSTLSQSIDGPVTAAQG
jgi:hypothetical protein